MFGRSKRNPSLDEAFDEWKLPSQFKSDELGLRDEQNLLVFVDLREGDHFPSLSGFDNADLVDGTP